MTTRLTALFAPLFCVALAVATTSRLRAQEFTALATVGAAACLPGYQEAADLVAVGQDVSGRQWLQPDAARAWRAMQRAAKADRVSLLLVSAFRSVDQQRQIFERKSLLEDFEGTAAFRWLHAHARDYGFPLSYPRGNPAGLAYEPWHWAFGQTEASLPGCQLEESPAFTVISRRFHARLHGGAPHPSVTE